MSEQTHAHSFNGFRFNEKYLSQIPALQLLINLGYEYLTPRQALDARKGKTGNVILENVLQKQLKDINRIQYKGREFRFSEENIQSAIQKLKNVKHDGLLKTNEKIYDLLTQFKNLHTRMRQMFPRACYLGFTGTPLMKKEKNNFMKFGGLIDQYSIDQAVKDGAVVPLLYEGRHGEMEQNKKAIDLWFDRHTQGLTKEQKEDL